MRADVLPMNIASCSRPGFKPRPFDSQPSMPTILNASGSFNIMSSSNFFSSSFSFADAKLSIVEPFPNNIFAIEFSAAQVTCVAFDSTGETTPEKIKFFRRDVFNREHEIIANGSLYFTNRTQSNGRWMTVKYNDCDDCAKYLTYHYN